VAPLHVARPDHHVAKAVAPTFEGERLAAERALEHLQPFFHQGHASRHRHAEAGELVGRVAHAQSDLDATAADVIQHGQVLCQTHGIEPSRSSQAICSSAWR
jgi:hypothetical protein